MSNVEIHTGDVVQEFPDFPHETLPSLALPVWQDKSWRNDVCPSWVATFSPVIGGKRVEFLFVLWVQWPDEEDREVPGEGRLLMVIYDVTDDEHRDKYYQGLHDIEAQGETVDELVSDLTGEAGLEWSEEDGIRLYAAAASAVVRYLESNENEEKGND